MRRVGGARQMFSRTPRVAKDPALLGCRDLPGGRLMYPPGRAGEPFLFLWVFSPGALNFDGSKDCQDLRGSSLMYFSKGWAPLPSVCTWCVMGQVLRLALSRSLQGPQGLLMLEASRGCQGPPRSDFGYLWERPSAEQVTWKFEGLVELGKSLQGP
jgi:hypothetical protein